MSHARRINILSSTYLQYFPVNCQNMHKIASCKIRIWRLLKSQQVSRDNNLLMNELIEESSKVTTIILKRVNERCKNCIDRTWYIIIHYNGYFNQSNILENIFESLLVKEIIFFSKMDLAFHAKSRMDNRMSYLIWIFAKFSHWFNALRAINFSDPERIQVKEHL